MGTCAGNIANVSAANPGDVNFVMVRTYSRADS